MEKALSHYEYFDRATHEEAFFREDISGIRRKLNQMLAKNNRLSVNTFRFFLAFHGEQCRARVLLWLFGVQKSSGVPGKKIKISQFRVYEITVKLFCLKKFSLEAGFFDLRSLTKKILVKRSFDSDLKDCSKSWFLLHSLLHSRDFNRNVHTLEQYARVFEWRSLM